jgi:hypothetical protein
MTVKRKTYAAGYTRSEAVRRRSSARARRQPPRQRYGPIFFIVMGVTVAGAVGFLGVVASVLAGS